MTGFGRERVSNEWQVSLVRGRIESPVLDPSDLSHSDDL